MAAEHGFALLAIVPAVWLTEMCWLVETVVACFIAAWGGTWAEFWWRAVRLCIFV
jgi:hypothetical protein